MFFVHSALYRLMFVFADVYMEETRAVLLYTNVRLW